MLIGDARRAATSRTSCLRYKRHARGRGNDRLYRQRRRYRHEVQRSGAHGAGRLRGNRARSASSDGAHRVRSRRTAFDLPNTGWNERSTSSPRCPHALPPNGHARPHRFLVVGDPDDRRMDPGLVFVHFARSAGSRRSGHRSLYLRSAARETSRTICARSIANVEFVGTIGDDAFAVDVRRLLREEQVDDTGVFNVADRPTTRKTRIVAHNQQVVRADWEVSAPVQPADRVRIAAHVRERASKADAVILSDYCRRLAERRDRRRGARVSTRARGSSCRTSGCSPASRVSRPTFTRELRNRHRNLG